MSWISLQIFMSVTPIVSFLREGFGTDVAHVPNLIMYASFYVTFHLLSGHRYGDGSHC